VEITDRGDGVFVVPNTPWRFSEAESGAHGEPAYRGEHNREVLKEFGDFTDEELDKLEANEVLSSRVPRGGSA
jgi:crotonobetainyl-CoA:carnitine CoA-transferase CaiB-like acyl-CoA transferase